MSQLERRLIQGDDGQGRVASPASDLSLLSTEVDSRLHEFYAYLR